MSASCSFFNLPPEISCKLLSVWLCGSSINRFDIACCSRATREGVRRLFSAKQLVFTNLAAEDNFTIAKLHKFIAWVRERNVHVRKFVGIGGMDIGLFESALLTQEHTMRDLSVRDTLPKHDLWGIFFAVALHCHRLQRLSLHKCHLNKSIVTVVRNCPLLREFFAVQCNGLQDCNFGDISCPELQTVALNDCICDAVCLESMLGLSENICNLSLNNCSGVDTMEIEVVHRLFARLSRLRKLTLRELGISDEWLIAMSSHCAQLQEVDLGWCESVGDEGVTALAQNCKQLAVLYVDGCTGLTDVGITAVADHCPLLKTIDVTGITDMLSSEGLAQFCSKCHVLETLFTKTLDVAVIRSFPVSLRHLTVRGVRVTDAYLSAIGQHCKLLTHLSIENSHCTDQGLASIAAGCADLTHLFLTKEIDALARSLWRQMRPNLAITAGYGCQDPRKAIISEGMIFD